MPTEPRKFRWPMARVLSFAWEGLEKPSAVLWIIAGYCALHWAIRLGLSPVYSLDEAEQMLLAQDLSLSYGLRNPPLFTWMTWGTQQLLGITRPAYFLMKYLMIFAGLAGFFLAGLAALKNSRLAALATAAFAMTYTAGYYPHLDLSHSVLMFAMLGLGLWTLTRVLEHGGWRDYFLYGLVMALGVLSKYNFGLFLLAAPIAVVMVPALRKRINPVRAAASLALMLALTAPYMAWALTQDQSFVDLAQEVTRKADMEETPFLGGRLRGMALFAYSLLEFTLPFSLIFLALFWAFLRLPSSEGLSQENQLRMDYVRLFERVMIVAASLLLAAILISGIDNFNSRYMFPVLMPLPLALFGRMLLASEAKGLPAFRLRAYGGFALGIAVLVVAGRILSFEMNGAACKKCWEYQPFDRYAKGLRNKGFVKGTIIVDHTYVGGNLRPYFPESRIVINGYPLSIFPEATSPGSCAIAWLKDDNKIPEALGPLRAKLGVDPLPQHHQRLRVRSKVHPESTRWFAMNYVFMPDGTRECR